MEFTLTAALPEDAPAITDVFFASFTNALSQRMTPDTEDVRAFETAFFKDAAEEAQSSKGTDFIKVVATGPGQEQGQGQDPVIAGFAIWKHYEGEKDPHEGEKIEWPPSSDSALCESFFSGVDQERKKAIGDQPHYYLSMLGVDPKFGRQGLGGRLLKWGLDRADQEQLITFISSSPAGRGLYEKHGSRAVHSYEVIPGYYETSMVRSVGGVRRCK